MMRARLWTGIGVAAWVAAGALLATGCGGDDSTGSSVTPIDVEGGLDARADGTVTGDVPADAGDGAAVDAADASPDASQDVGQDAAQDAGEDAGPDAVSDGTGEDTGAGDVAEDGTVADGASGDVSTCTSDADCAGLVSACLTATCDAATGTCQTAPVDAGTACDDGDACTADDACDGAGACVGSYQYAPDTCPCAEDAHCDDGQGCTVDTCDAATGLCEYAPAPGSCLVDGVCYSAGTPSVGDACMVCDPETDSGAWTARTCDDGNACTDDSCDTLTGCLFTPNDANPCDDGNDCSSDDACVDGVCVGTCSCSTDADCDGFHAVGACQRAACVAGACAAVADDALDGQACDDGDPCTTGETCAAGVCAGGAPVECDPLIGGDGCTVAACNPTSGACEPTPAPAGTACDDGESCTAADACDGAGQCVGVWQADDASCPCAEDAQCEDGLSCTQDVCDVATGSCQHLTLPDTCLVDGACFAAGETSPTNACLVCEPGAVGGGAQELVPRTCDDDNPCTGDGCDSASGCVFTPDDAATCDDGDPCSTDDHCDAGQCVGTCACATDADCQGLATLEVGACERAACVASECVVLADAAQDGALCDDGDACTFDTVCANGVCGGGGAVDCSVFGDGGGCQPYVCNPNTGECVVDPQPAGTACDDGDACTVDDACDAGGACAGATMDCTAFADACHAGACQNGACTQTPLPDSTACDDGDACTVADHCLGGVCQGTFDASAPGCTACGSAADCDDGLSCTVDTCGGGQCAHEVLAGHCLVDGACYGDGDVRADNACLVCDSTVSRHSLQSRSCDDDNACTDDSCEPASGCVNTPDDTNACDDGDPCSSDDHCDGGACVGTCECMADTDCQGDAPVCERWTCQNYHCVAIPDDAQEGQACSDGDPCSVGEVCAAGACQGGVPKDCSALDDGVCLEGACDGATGDCVAQPVADGTTCDDQELCTDNDVCVNGACAGTPIVCDGDACNDGVCNPDDGTCGVVPKEDGTTCSDGNDCTTGDACQAGACVGSWDTVACGCSVDQDCASLDDDCNIGRCDVGSHACYAEPQQGQACDDGVSCTSGDVCGSDGTCHGAAYSCADGLSCTDDVCDGQGGCNYVLLPGSCNIDNQCYAAGDTNPDNPCQVCVAGTSWSANDGAACDDGDACSYNDHCAAGACAGTTYTCSGLACETGTCDGQGGCDFAVNDGWCAIDGVCRVAGANNPQNGCQSCLPDQDDRAWSNNTRPCDDGIACTADDICSNGVCAGTPYACDDGLACTTDSCNGVDCDYVLNDGKCLIGGACYDAAETRPGNVCQRCDPAEATGAWSPSPAATACDDGLSCTSGDACDGAGTCVGSTDCAYNPQCEDAQCVSGGCEVTLQAGWCKIGSECYPDGATNPDNPCEVCASGQSTTAWTANTGAACDDGEACTHTDTCQADATCAGTAYSCDDSLGCTADACDGAGGCSHTTDAGACVIDTTCYVDGDVDPANPCQSCQVAQSQTAWSPVPDTTSCDPDTLDCTVDHCDGAGACVHTPADGTCAIDGACYAKGDLNPANECESCDPATPTAWSAVSAGSACTEGDTACTSGQCDGAGACVQHDHENFSDCDDGVAETHGDWCYGGICGGFTQTLSPSGSCDDDDKFYRSATAAGTGVHAIYRRGSNSFFSCNMHFHVQTLDAGQVHDDQQLGAANSGDTAAIWGDNLASSDTLYTKVGGTWTSANTNGTLRRAWNNVSGNWQTRWVGLRMLASGQRFLGVGRKTDGTPLARSCAYLCQAGGNCNWFCSDDSVSASTDVSLVDLAATPDGRYLGGFRTSASSSSLQPIVDFYRSGLQSWAELAQAGAAAGASLNDFIEVGANVLGVGNDGVMVWGPPDSITQVCAARFEGYDLREVATFDGEVFVLYTRELTATLGGGRVFGVAHTHVDADTCTSWVLHDVISYLDVGPAGPGNFTGDPNTWDYDYRTIATDADEMYLLGSWWSAQADRRVKSYMRWMTP